MGNLELIPYPATQICLTGLRILIFAAMKKDLQISESINDE